MPHDPARLEDTQTWLVKAGLDLSAGAHDLTAMPPLTGDAVFHAQQAAEKALKGFLAWHDVPFGKTHDLAALGRQCAAIDASLAPIAQRATPLTDFAWKYRYPGPSSDPSREEAQSAPALAREVYDAILPRLPDEVRPAPR
jgi:HEPN domain-containing protein